MPRSGCLALKKKKKKNEFKSVAFKLSSLAGHLLMTSAKNGRFFELH